jgi:DNA-binding transcriptional ArsR family regulator
MVTKEQSTDRVMDALGHKTRRDILALLKEAPLPVGGIAERMPISRPAVSKHLRILEDAGLVEYTSIGTRNVFRLSTQGFLAARIYVEGFWDQALDNFKSIAEGSEEAGS